ncbi:hypothetical protein [Zoogloea sp.]|uniref:hypothetical protein n=1 Tax=Zoogloea sp. TaxID=49181 RepID=UPI002602E2BB|nr:hypothetical protein [uncultured Zoogloea sp.]
MQRLVGAALLVLAGLSAGGAALADARVAICFNYGCLAEAEVVFTEAQLGEVARSLGRADSAVAERAILGQVMGQLYRWAGTQSPISADRPGDFLDDGAYGAMDCIDHAESTTRLLRLLEGRGMLRFHAVEPIRRRTRWVVTQHFSAVVRENVEAPQAGASFVVDTWFGEHGDPAVVLPLEDWLDGEGPNVS